MDWTIDSFLEFAGKAISSVGVGIESVLTSVDSLLSDFKLSWSSDDADTPSVSTDSPTISTDAPSPTVDSGSLNVSPVSTAKEVSLFDQGLDFVKKNPELSKLGAGLIGGAIKGYQTDKALAQQDKQFRERLDAEKEMLRDRYKYDAESQMQIRKQRQQEAYKMFTGGQ